MSESGFERLAVIGICSGLEVVYDTGSRKLQTLALLVAVDLFGAFALRVAGPFCRLARFHLGFYVLTFPSLGHDNSLTQFVDVARM